MERSIGAQSDAVLKECYGEDKELSCEEAFEIEGRSDA